MPTAPAPAILNSLIYVAPSAAELERCIYSDKTGKSRNFRVPVAVRAALDLTGTMQLAPSMLDVFFTTQFHVTKADGTKQDLGPYDESKLRVAGNKLYLTAKMLPLGSLDLGQGAGLLRATRQGTGLEFWFGHG